MTKFNGDDSSFNIQSNGHISDSITPIPSRRDFLKGGLVVGAFGIFGGALSACGDSTIDPQNMVIEKVRDRIKPNRITSTLKKNTKNERSFCWFSSKLAGQPQVLIAETRDMKNAKAFPALTTQVSSHYLDRDENDYLLFKVKDKETDNVIRTFTDEGIDDVKWNYKEQIENDNEKIEIDIIKIEETRYHADVSGLKPSTTYYYQVGDKEYGFSDIGQFKTSGSQEDPFTFIHYTDTQNAFWNEHIRNEAQYGADTLEQAQSQSPNAEFVLHTGDVVEVAEIEDEWYDLMSQSQESLLKMSLVPVSGNHDEYGLTEPIFPTKFNDHFNVDSEGKIDGGSYYSFDYNNAHFIVLNTNDNKNGDKDTAKKALGAEQLEWLKKDVQEAKKNGAQWTILSYHKPLFSKSYHSLQDEDVQNVREEFMKLIDELDIDLALQGHDHVFSRTKPLQFDETGKSFVNAKLDQDQTKENTREFTELESPKGTTFVIPNTGGTKAYDAIFNKSLEHIHKVRPKLDWLTEVQLKEYKDLFAKGEQPQDSDAFKTSHSNYRDSSEQNFAVYEINKNKLVGIIYQVSGDFKKGEKRTTKEVDRFTITK